MVIHYLQRQNHDYAAQNESLKQDFNALTQKYNALQKSSAENETVHKVTLKALQRSVAMQSHLETDSEMSISSAQRLILLNGIIGSAHYACFIPAVLKSITLQPPMNSLKYLTICAGFNVLNGFYALSILPKSGQTGLRMVQYLACANVVSIGMGAYLYWRRPGVISNGYLMMSAAVNTGLLSLSLFEIVQLKR